MNERNNKDYRKQDYKVFDTDNEIITSIKNGTVGIYVVMFPPSNSVIIKSGVNLGSNISQTYHKIIYNKSLYKELRNKVTTSDICFKILEYSDLFNYRERKKYWIEKYSGMGFDILNKYDKPIQEKEKNISLFKDFNVFDKNDNILTNIHNEKAIYGIYWEKTNELYIGSTDKLNQRLNNHKSKFKHNKNIPYLQEKFNQDNDCCFYILYDSIGKYDDLHEIEQYYINSCINDKNSNTKIINRNINIIRMDKEKHSIATKKGMEKYYGKLSNITIQPAVSVVQINSINECYNTQYSKSLMVI